MNLLIHIDTTEVQRRRGLARRALGLLVRRVTAAVEGEALKVVPKKEDNLFISITSNSEGGGSATRGVVKATAPYALWVHRGTGIYGPDGWPIVAKPGKAFLIPVPGATEIPDKPGFIFRKSFKGMKGRPFFEWAAKAVVTRVPEIARDIYRTVFGSATDGGWE